MPDFKHYTLRQLDEALQQIEAAIYTPVAGLSVRGWCTSEPLTFERRREGSKPSGAPFEATPCGRCCGYRLLCAMNPR